MHSAGFNLVIRLLLPFYAARLRWRLLEWALRPGRPGLGRWNGAMLARVQANILAGIDRAAQPSLARPEAEVSVGRTPPRRVFAAAITSPQNGQQIVCIADSDGRRRAVIDVNLN